MATLLNGFVADLAQPRDAVLSARVPSLILREVSALAKSRKWSVADAVIFLVVVGLDSVKKQAGK